MEHSIVTGDLDEGIPQKCRTCEKYDNVHKCSSAFIVALVNATTQLYDEKNGEYEVVIPDFSLQLSRCSFALVADHVLDKRDMEKEMRCFITACEKAKDYNLRDGGEVKDLLSEGLLKDVEKLIDEVQEKVLNKKSDNPFLDAFNRAAYNPGRMN